MISQLSSWEITQPNLNLGTFYDTELNSEGEGPSRGLLRDYESSDGPSFEALISPDISTPGREQWF